MNYRFAIVSAYSLAFQRQETWFNASEQVATISSSLYLFVTERFPVTLSTVRRNDEYVCAPVVICVYSTVFSLFLGFSLQTKMLISCKPISVFIIHQNFILASVDEKFIFWRLANFFANFLSLN